MGPTPVEADVIKLKKEKNIIGKRKELFINSRRIQKFKTKYYL